MTGQCLSNKNENITTTLFLTEAGKKALLRRFLQPPQIKGHGLLPASVNQIKNKKNPSTGSCSPSRSSSSPSKRRRSTGRIGTAIQQRSCTSTPHPGFSSDRASPHRIRASPCRIELHLAGSDLLITKSGGSLLDRAPTPMPPLRRMVMHHRGPTPPPEGGGRCRGEGAGGDPAPPTRGLF